MAPAREDRRARRWRSRGWPVRARAHGRRARSRTPPGSASASTVAAAIAIKPGDTCGPMAPEEECWTSPCSPSPLVSWAATTVVSAAGSGFAASVTAAAARGGSAGTGAGGVMASGTGAEGTDSASGASATSGWSGLAGFVILTSRDGCGRSSYSATRAPDEPGALMIVGASGVDGGSAAWLRARPAPLLRLCRGSRRGRRRPGRRRRPARGALRQRRNGGAAGACGDAAAVTA